MNQLITRPESFNHSVEDPFTHDWYGQEDVRITAKYTDQKDISLSIEVYDSFDKHWRYIDKGFIPNEVITLPANTSNQKIIEAMKLHYFNAIMNGLNDEYVF